MQENTYLLYNEQRQCAIVDPGCYFDEEKEQLSAFIETNSLQPTLLLNTHCHLDHVFGNKYVADKYGLTLHMHRSEKIVLDYSPSSGLMYNMPFDSYSGDFIFLDDGGNIKLGNDDLLIFHTPGHSPGSISFYNKAQQFVLSGDVLFSNSIGRTDLPGGNFDTLMKSIKEKMFTLPGEVVVYSGHGPATTIAKEIQSNPYVS